MKCYLTKAMISLNKIDSLSKSISFNKSCRTGLADAENAWFTFFSGSSVLSIEDFQWTKLIQFSYRKITLNLVVQRHNQ